MGGFTAFSASTKGLLKKQVLQVVGQTHNLSHTHKSDSASSHSFALLQIHTKLGIDSFLLSFLP